MPDPLTVQCWGCDDSPDAVPCDLTTLTFACDVTERLYDYDQAWSIELTDGEDLSVVVDSTGHTEVELVPFEDWYDAWDDLKIKISTGHSIIQVYAIGKRAEMNASWYIQCDYTCTKGGDPVQGQRIFAFNQQTDLDSYEEDGVIFTVTQIGKGGGSAVLYKSASLVDYSSHSEAGDFQPKPKLTSLDMANSAEACLCVSGGTAPYGFTAIGLPYGVTLDPQTGCISGNPSGDENHEVTVMVTDSARNSASITCSLINACGSSVDKLKNLFG